MPTNNGSVFSETLQEITNTKLEELSKRRSEFETAKADVISRLESELNPLSRLELLSRGVRECFAMKTTKTGEILPGSSKNPDLVLELENLDSFMAQSKYDPSVTPLLMQRWEESLLRRLDMQSSKFQYASLYAQLVTEWLSTEKPAAAAATPEDADMAEGYEDVGDSMKKEARRGWEQVVFQPAGVDEQALKSYLVDLFGLEDQDRPAKAKGFEQLRDKLTAFENTLATPKQFDAGSLTWVINGLLASDLLTDERREVLRDFLGNQTILAEVADVLNMRLAALSTWSWGESVGVEQQRKITGVYNVLMHEDVLQAIFLHYIGVKWSVFLKSAFRQFRKFDGAWKSSRRSIPELDQKRRKVYLGDSYTQYQKSVYAARDHVYRKHYFMASLMGREDEKKSSLEGEEEANYSAQNLPLMCQQRPITRMRRRAAHRQNFGGFARDLDENYAQDAAALEDFDFDPSSFLDDSHSDSESQDRNPMEDKQRLIRLLSTELAVSLAARDHPNRHGAPRRVGDMDGLL
ncbi:hypothetical protein ONZ43_g4360 [Nemania bipapillata]|uniref:Uncharacterized protein n=1 Tax=Nemania bipapillata TaxID=110536 RepID=A0ACC2INS9_9PEZI|nr:hypothetical protein ONZ43_g4360 [Nemania bipapillata]